MDRLIVRMTLHNSQNGLRRVEEINLIFPLGGVLLMSGLMLIDMMIEVEPSVTLMDSTMTATILWTKGTGFDLMGCPQLRGALVGGRKNALVGVIKYMEMQIDSATGRVILHERLKGQRKEKKTDGEEGGLINGGDDIAVVDIITSDG